jgi:alkylation response protein AidB-like acyl-CoA dehydrogenase
MSGTGWPARPGLTDDQIEIGRTVLDFVTDTSSEADVRRVMATPLGFDPTVWDGLCELGVPGLAVPEEYGGLGLGRTELGLVQEIAGAALLCAPLLSSAVLAAGLLTEVGTDDAKADLLPPLAAGTRRGTVALAAAHPDLVLPATDGIMAEQSGGRWQLSGRAVGVIDGTSADDLLVVSRVGLEPAVFAVTGDADGLTRSPMDTLDLTRRQADVVFDRTPARLVACGEHIGAGLTRAMDLALVMVAAEQAGGTRRCLDTAVEYAGTRVQFDRVIGSFQAVKHTCANMLVHLEGSYAAMADAVRTADFLPPDRLPVAASVAKVACSQAFSAVASDALHVHGGIGFTWEHASHLYFRRAKSTQLMFGTPAQHQERLLTRSRLTEVAGG